MTSSARADSVGDTSRPSAFAVLRLITNSNFVDRMTGRSAGFSPLRIGQVGSIACQPAGFSELTPLVDCRHPLSGHEGDKPFAPAENERIGCDNKATRTRMGNGRKGGLEVDFAAGVQDMKLHPERARRLPKLPSLILGIRVHRVYKGSKRGGLGNELAEQPQSLSLQFGGEEASRP
jgi:hypothetical protein